MKVVAEPIQPTVPATAVNPSVRVMFAVVNVEQSIGSLKAMLKEPLTENPLDVFAGLINETVGAVTSGAAPVVKFQAYRVVRAFPAKSLAPVVILAV
ncbi:hypothetical protein DLM76_21275 [Leptospira yasudae]|nr:hypothetical protein DLM76_21275 [Leptospira yasudae]